MISVFCFWNVNFEMITVQLEVFYPFSCTLRSFNLKNDWPRLQNSWLSYLIHFRPRIQGQRWQVTLQWVVFSPCNQQSISFSAHAPSIFSSQRRPTFSFPSLLISFSLIPLLVWSAGESAAFLVVYLGNLRICVLYREPFPILTFLSSSQSLIIQSLEPSSFHGIPQVSPAF